MKSFKNPNFETPAPPPIRACINPVIFTIFLKITSPKPLLIDVHFAIDISNRLVTIFLCGNATSLK